MADTTATETLATRRRREARHEEYQTQRQVIGLLAKHLDPARTFFTSLENLPRSPIAAIHQQRRGVRAGLPDVAVIIRGPLEGFVKLVFLELKSRRGQASPRQRDVAAEIMAAGGAWWLARSPRAALRALTLEGVGLGRWRPPVRLEPWEGPFGPAQRRLPMHPAVAREQRAARRRWRARQRAREAARISKQPSPTAPDRQPEVVDARA